MKTNRYGQCRSFQEAVKARQFDGADGDWRLGGEASMIAEMVVQPDKRNDPVSE
jgi:hypothetical protein